MTQEPRRRRFADPALVLRQEHPEQLPLDGDDRLLSTTTGRFRLYVGDRVVQAEADVAGLVARYRTVGLDDPTVHQLRSGFALMLDLYDQVRLVQLAADEPKPEPVPEDPDAPREPWSSINDVDDIGALPVDRPPRYFPGELKQYMD